MAQPNRDFSKLTCPEICPKPGQPSSMGQGLDQPLSTRDDHGGTHTYAKPYVPGLIRPPEKRVYPPGAPPLYLPQSSDTTSGDILVMGPIGPWAPGHLDWSPQAGTTGVRPVVDKYSITRYSTGEWRKNNEYVLRAIPVAKSQGLKQETEKIMDDGNAKMDAARAKANQELDNRIKEVKRLKKRVEKAVEDIANEIETLDRDRATLKGACRILMLPEAISRECLELRTSRLEPDLVRDDAEQELVKEVAIVGEIRRVFNETLAKVERQMEQNKAAKVSIESDWSDKLATLKVDKRNAALTDEANIALFHRGVARWPENATTLEYYNHYCNESVRNCDEVRNKSERLRANLMEIITKGGQDLKTQADRTNEALEETITTNQALCSKLEDTLRDTLQKTADTEKLIEAIKEAIQATNQKQKLGMTRLHTRNYERPNVENCRDKAQYALMEEEQYVKETLDKLETELRKTEAVRADLIKYRGDLEKQIACKRKSLNIEDDRFRRIRAHFPKAEEFAMVA